MKLLVRGEKRMKRSEESLCNLWDTSKRANLHFWESQKRERSAEGLFKEIMAKKLPNIVRKVEI